MDDQELEALLLDMESDRVERTISTTDSDKFRKAICAFANDLPNHKQPGVLFIGVNDDGSCANITIDDSLLRSLASLRSDILPFPSMQVQKRTLAGCELVAIIVEPSDAPPVRVNGRTWIRVGPTRATATPEEERRLAEKRRARDIPFDIQSVASATLDDLSLDIFQRVYLPSALPVEILEQNQRSTGQQLTSLRFATSGPNPQPTVLGILVIGTDPGHFLPGAYVQFLRFDGLQLTDPIKDQKEITGALPDLLRILDETLQVNVSVALDITSQPSEIRHPDYPIVALQQLARNAILHRTYEGTNAPVRINWFSDHVEIISPGGPFGQVNRENFGQPGITDYRNPHLAEAMKNLGYIQRFGVGIQLARSELEKNSNPSLEFTIEQTYIGAIIRKRA